MPSPTRTITGIIIGLSPRAEHYTRWEVLTSAEGFVNVTASTKIAQPFGLFDTVELVASARGRNLFLKEARLLARPSALAQNLVAFTEAARLAKLTHAAFREMPDYKPIYEIFSKALEHYTNNADRRVADPEQGAKRLVEGPDLKAHPVLVTLKAFYKMLLAEGFPVQQDWLEKLSPPQYKQAKALLGAKLSSSIGEVEETLAGLIVWAGHELGARL